MKKFLKRVLGKSDVTVDISARRPAQPNGRARGTAVFEDSDGRPHVIDENLRYGMKETWRVFSPLSFLAELNERRLLDSAGVELLKKLRGRRTITAPLDEIRSAVAPYADKFRDLLIDPALTNIGKRVLKPRPNEVDEKIRRVSASHTRRLRTITTLGYDMSARGKSVLEIGFISGGESLVAFERLGFNAAGLDYFYDGTLDGVLRYQEVQKVSGTNARFEFGDITRKTDFSNQEFDLIFSAQVLEHIENLPAAFREMYRILKPGGIMCHIYEPYFHPLGGHSFGTLDFPWGHLRLAAADFDRYIKELRPFESEHALRWCHASLNRGNTIQVVERTLAQAGFLIRSWKQSPWRGAMGINLTTDVIRECLERNPHVSLADLVTSGIQVIAEKA